jgi:hypothetical protein
VTVGNFLIQA